MVDKLSTLEAPLHDEIDAIIREFAVPVDHQPANNVLNEETINTIQR